MDLVDPRVDRYLDELFRADDPVLAEMEALGRERGFPIIGPQVGRLIQTLALSVGARRVLELGSGFGYSAYFFARAVGPEGEVVLTEYSAEDAGRATEFLRRAGLDDRVRVEVGDGLALAPTLPHESFDVVFNDVEKEEYPRAFEVARPLIRPGGLFISDNMLWYGRVLEPEPGDRDTAGVDELTRRLLRDEQFVTSLIPMRDGVTVSVKSRSAADRGASS